jgi:glucosamine--fructose-6-phosphate aminotransferase (isomerizing)
MYLGSDALALAPLTDRICYLEEGDWVTLNGGGVRIRDVEGREVEREVKLTALSGALIGKGQYRHFMQKEIFEQPAVIGDTLHTLVNPLSRQVELPELGCDLGDLPRVTINACGTAYLAGLVAKYWFEQLAGQPTEVDIASEFRYREAPLPAGGVSLFISQSGETIDTLAALRYARQAGQRVVAVVNVPESAIERESDAVLHTLAGPEIGVASTKAFTTQLAVLACLAIATARARGAIDAAREAELTLALTEVPARAAEVLNHDSLIRRVAHEVSEARDVLYLGRGTAYPIALEGALKLKEISYIHAEGYAAGEMKHGPIALIDESVPVIVCAPSGLGATVRQDHVERAGGHRPRRPGRPHFRRRGRGALGRPGDPCDRAAGGRSLRRPAALRHTGPAPRLSRRSLERHRRRPTQKPRQERDGRITPPRALLSSATSDTRPDPVLDLMP